MFLNYIQIEIKLDQKAILKSFVNELFKKRWYFPVHFILFWKKIQFSFKKLHISL